MKKGAVFEVTDFSTFSVWEALNYQKEHNHELEVLAGNIANKFKIVINDFFLMKMLSYQAVVTQKLMAVIGLRKLLSIEASPPIQAVVDANLLPVFSETLFLLVFYSIFAFEFFLESNLFLRILIVCFTQALISFWIF